MYIMADKLSDEELAEQLAKYGEKIKLPLTESRRSILRKKLNHLLAKNRRRSAPVRQKTSRNDLSGFSSDDTDSEYVTSPRSSSGFASPATSYSTSNVSRSRSTRISTSNAGNTSTGSAKPSSQQQYHRQSDRRRATTTPNHETDTRHPTSSSPNIPNNTAGSAPSPYSGWHNATSQSAMMHSHNSSTSSTPQALKSTIKSGSATTPTTTAKKYAYKVTIPYGTPPAPSVSPGFVDGVIGNSGYPNHHHQQQQHHHPHHHLHSQQQQQTLQSRVHPSTTLHTRGRRSSSRTLAAAVAAAAAAQKKSRPGTTIFESSDSDLGLDDDDDDDDDDDEDEEDADPAKLTSSSLNSTIMSSSAYSPSSSFLNNSDNPAKYSTTVNRTPTSKILKEFRHNYTKARKNPYKPGNSFWNPYSLCCFDVPFRERNSHCVSWVLPMIAALFFLVLGIVYVRNWNNNETLPENNEAFLRIQDFCKYNDNKVFDNCSNYHIDNILRLLKIVYEDLSDKYGKVECGYTTDVNSQKISIVELRRLIAKNLNEMDTEPFAKMMLHLVTDSEDWGIRTLAADGRNTSVAEEVKYLESCVPNMNFICRLRRAVLRMIYQLLLGFLVFIFSVLLFRFYLVKRKNTEEEQRQVYEMVEKIIDILKCHCEALARQDEDTYLAVQHVRDQLLPPAQRKQLLTTWEKAAKFIEDNESRIRLETRTIEGEEFQVWRWLPNLNNGGKIWQGQAFGEHDEAGTPPYSPTPCLKVRNMFEVDMEEGENWQINIEDAILEKCKNISGVLHIYVDKGSREGCVYIKCDTCVTAGQVHRALHGWWFDRRLVTVKYLRLEYYHERFPDSRVAITPMHPSTSSRMHSLSQPFHKSTLEMT